ncbi:GNAT family N-acetyltransferase [Sphaerisporangium rufum]|uniref:GNAT family N-acetyltransferase n=1 Tax=Sphaerisporangium rufum TaxID=1381558 RepID=UPI001EF32394|nr:GNAT family N-acetyltransferase [Sphaerisporangium rufum]
MTVVVSPGSWLCPAGWTGIVTLGGAALATVPEAGLVDPVRRVLLADLGGTGVELSGLSARLPVHDVLGPATLAYLDADDFVSAHIDAGVERLPADDCDVARLVAAVDDQDADESGVDEVDSAVWAIREGRKVIAAAGYRSWSDGVAHLSVLVDAERRGRGLARLVASAAVAEALAEGLLPQWKARPEPSRRVARALGFRELGSQLSLLLRPPAGSAGRR